MIWLGKLLNVVDVMRRSQVDGITDGILISTLMNGGRQKINRSILNKQQLKLNYEYSNSSSNVFSDLGMVSI